MTKVDWRKAKEPRIASLQSGSSEIGDRAAQEDRDILDEIAEKRREDFKKIRKKLNKLPSNWLKTPEEVAAYKAKMQKRDK